MRRRHPQLHQRGAIYYFFRFDEQGKRHEESLRTTDLEDAIERHKTRTEEIGSGRSPNDLCRRNLQEAIAFWLSHRKLRVAPGTFKAENSIARNLIRIFGGDVKLKSLADICLIRSYQDARRSAKISPKTVNNEVQALASILGLAGLWRRVEAQYKPLRVMKSDLPDALTLDEGRRLLTMAANSDPNAVAPYAAVLAFSTGLRSGEIKCLRVADLHHEEIRPYLQVRRATTKTDAGARRVVLDTIAVWAVRKLVARARLLDCTAPEHYLLPTDRGRHTRSHDPLHGASGFDPLHSQSSWEAEWTKFRKVVGISSRRFHDLRHSYVTRAAEAGVPVAVVQAQVGHLSAAMVAHYTHISEQALFEAARRIENQSMELLACLGLQRRDANGGEGRTVSDGEAAEIAGLSVQ